MEDRVTNPDLAAEIARLQKLLRQRDGKSGYAQNVEAIKARLKELGA